MELPHSHARVLIVVARDPAIRLRYIAAACHITERTAQNIVHDLEQAGYRTGRLHAPRAQRTALALHPLHGRHPPSSSRGVRARPGSAGTPPHAGER